MGFNQIAGTSIVPTISRIVLGLAFVTIGWNKFTVDGVYTTPEREILALYGLEVEPRGAAMDPEPQSARPTERVIHLASFVQDAEPGDVPPSAEVQPAAPTDPDAADKDPVIPADDLDAASDEANEAVSEPIVDDGKRYTGPGWYRVTLMSHQHGLPLPKYAGVGAAVTELVGGAALLLGFLTRIWALGLAIVMAVAVYISSIQGNGWLIEVTDPFVFARDLAAYKTLYLQLGLFALAFGLVLTGAGPLSIDRLFFGGGRKGERPPRDEVKAAVRAARGGGRPAVDRGPSV